jgi:hypothetical protein
MGPGKLISRKDGSMALRVRISEVIPPAMVEQHREHIRDFLAQEGIAEHPDDLAATEMSERQVKELLEELAETLD